MMAEDGGAKSLGDIQREKGKAVTERTLDAIERMRSEGRRITFSTVAAEAGVSRSYLYRKNSLRTAIEDARDEDYPTFDEKQLPKSLPEAYELICDVQGRVLKAERDLADAKQQLEALRRYVGKLVEQTGETQ